MQFTYTILYVDNVEQTLEFYEKAFGFKRKMLHESGDYGELDTGATTLSFSSLQLMKDSLHLIKDRGKNPASASRNSPTFEIAFSTKDVNGALKAAIQAGAELVQEAKEMPWGQTTAYVSDINGFLVELCTPME